MDQGLLGKLGLRPRGRLQVGPTWGIALRAIGGQDAPRSADAGRKGWAGDIAEALRQKVQSVVPLRANLIKKGMVWSPSYGNTGFTVPLFDGFMKRVMG